MISSLSITLLLFSIIAALLVIHFMIRLSSSSSLPLYQEPAAATVNTQELARLFNQMPHSSSPLSPLDSFKAISDSIGRANGSVGYDFFDPYKVKAYYKHRVWSNYSTGSDLLVMDPSCSSNCLGNFLSNYFEARTCARLAGRSTHVYCCRSL